MIARAERGIGYVSVRLTNRRELSRESFFFSSLETRTLGSRASFRDGVHMIASLVPTSLASFLNYFSAAYRLPISPTIAERKTTGMETETVSWSARVSFFSFPSFFRPGNIPEHIVNYVDTGF